eukprot:g728.t1
MRIAIDGLVVDFPYDSIYKEQRAYMEELKKILDQGAAPGGGHGLLEMPTGTGKTVALLSLILAYRKANRDKIGGKLIYCTRTVPEMTQVIDELKTVVEYRKGQAGSAAEESEQILGICLSSRRNMCIHDDVMKDNDLEEVDTKCRMKTAPWVRQSAMSEKDPALCEFFEMLHGDQSDWTPSSGIYGLEDLKQIGREKKLCPYFLTRKTLAMADVVVYNYQYMLDPKVSSLVSSQLDKDSIVVFDEAHNIDNVCIEAFSIALNKRILGAAAGNLSKLRRKVQYLRETDQKKLEDEYKRLVAGLGMNGASAGSRASIVVDASSAATKTSEDGATAAAAAAVEATAADASIVRSRGEDPTTNLNDYVAMPVLPADVLNEALPGNIRRAEHFLTFLIGVLEFLRKKIDVKDNMVVKKIPTSFRTDLLDFLSIQERKPLRFCYSRLGRLLRTLEITDVGEYTPLSLVADFATVLGTYDEGFMILIEPTQSHAPNLIDPLLQLTCTDSSLAIKPVFEKFRSVIITSGTLSPIDLYPNLLNFRPKVQATFQMSMPKHRPTIMCPLVVTKGNDQNLVSTKFELRNDPSVVRNYGELLVSLVRIVPDGIVCFFTSYQYMETTVSKWKETGVLDRVLKHKLIFIETKDIVETTLALGNYRRSCDCGRGAVFFSVARGKVAEGVNFEHHYGRCVVMFGIPFQYTKSRVLEARLDFLENKFQVKPGDFLTFDAMRQTAQCMGRVIRSKRDYGIMIFADSRYGTNDKWTKLPQWIQKKLLKEHRRLNTEAAAGIAGRFLRSMAQSADVATVAVGDCEAVAKKPAVTSMATTPAVAGTRPNTTDAASVDSRGSRKRPREGA